LSMFVDLLNPPLLDGASSMPHIWINIMLPKTILHNCLHVGGEATFEKNVRCGFLYLIAKLALSTILPPTFLKPILHPSVILNDQPSK
jgi:hypothetical protein